MEEEEEDMKNKAASMSRRTELNFRCTDTHTRDNERGNESKRESE